MATDRFVKAYSMGVFTTNEIWIDTLTGINYFFHTNGQAGGMTPLLDPAGNPVVTPIDTNQGYYNEKKR